MQTVITAQEAFAQGSKPWLLRHIARKHGNTPTAKECRKVADELASIWSEDATSKQ